LKLFKAVLTYVLAFIACMFVVATALQSWPAGMQILFAFGVPGGVVWWRRSVSEKKITNRPSYHSRQDNAELIKASRARAERIARESADGVQSLSVTGTSGDTLRPQGGGHSSLIPYRPKQNNADLIKSSRERAERLAREESKPLVSDANFCEPRGDAVRAPKVRPPLPVYRPNQDNAQLIQAGREARSALADAAQRRTASVQKIQQASHSQGWVPKGQTVLVAGRVLPGMVYVGVAPSVIGGGYGECCRAYIDQKQQVSSVGAGKSDDYMPYWPGYSSISAACRANYLDWLADGATDPTINPGYMFLYFYGLERRFLVDNPPEDEKREILAEVQRLRELFSANHSVQRYLGDFIDVAGLVLSADDLKAPVFKSWTWELPLSLKVTLGGMIANDIPLSAEWLLSWFLCHGEKRLRTPAHRCEDEFKALFCKKFDQRYPKGLKVAKSKKQLKCSYRAASGEFSRDLPVTANGRPVLDVSGLTKPVTLAQAIADEAMDELDKLSRFLGRNPERKGSFEAHALLPTCLWDQFPSEQRQDLINWVKIRIEAGGLVPVGEVFGQIGNQAVGKITKRQLTDLADALGSLGFGLAPDPRYGLRMPKEGEPVVLFEWDGSWDAESASTAYRKALIELALGAFIAQADGQVSESERHALFNRIARVRDVSALECRLLKANLDWFLAVPADIATLRSRLKDVDGDQKMALRSAMIAIAHADGLIKTEEVAGIERIYRILGLDPSTVYSDLHAGEVSDAPVRVKAAEPGAPGEAIPDEPSTSESQLDPNRIAAIRSDTARVSSVLGQIFQSEPDVEPEPSTSVSPIAGLDAKCAALVRDLIAKDYWSEDDFADLAKRHGLMRLGALEAINEWSFATYDEALLDEHDGYDVTDDIAQALKTQFEKEVA